MALNEYCKDYFIRNKHIHTHHTSGKQQPSPNGHLWTLMPISGGSPDANRYLLCGLMYLSCKKEKRTFFLIYSQYCITPNMFCLEAGVNHYFRSIYSSILPAPLGDRSQFSRDSATKMALVANPSLLLPNLSPPPFPPHFLPPHCSNC